MTCAEGDLFRDLLEIIRGERDDFGPYANEREIAGFLKRQKLVLPAGRKTLVFSYRGDVGYGITK